MWWCSYCRNSATTLFLKSAYLSPQGKVARGGCKSPACGSKTAGFRARYAGAPAPRPGRPGVLRKSPGSLPGGARRQTPWQRSRVRLPVGGRDEDHQAAEGGKAQQTQGGESESELIGATNIGKSLGLLNEDLLFIHFIHFLLAGEA